MERWSGILGLPNYGVLRPGPGMLCLPRASHPVLARCVRHWLKVQPLRAKPRHRVERPIISRAIEPGSGLASKVLECGSTTRGVVGRQCTNPCVLPTRIERRASRAGFIRRALPMLGFGVCRGIVNFLTPSVATDLIKIQRKRSGKHRGKRPNLASCIAREGFCVSYTRSHFNKTHEKPGIYSFT
jgi:hypothetical protein